MSLLNEAQSRAVAHGKGPCICLAGPGSGKTTVITRRVRGLIEDQKVRPEEILVLTFTKAAAMEMKERFQRMMGKKKYSVTFGTFHSVFFTILKYAYGYTTANILREEQKHQLLKEIVSSLHLEFDDESDSLAGIVSEISKIKNERISLEHYYSSNCSEEVFRKIYEKYQNRLISSRWIDFDDMLVYTYELFSERQDILEGWSRRFSYILIDEFQDINQIQYDVIRLLALPNNNLFIVGDDDQSIYRFRGAKPEIMLHFSKDYPDAVMIKLDKNYRSTDNIIKGAGRVILHNTARYPKEIHGVKEMGDKIEVHGFVSQMQENKYLVSKLQDYIQQGYSYDDVAVLFRTNTGARLLVSLFMEYNLPFCIRDVMPNIYEHWIAQDIISYIRLALGEKERKYFLRIMNRPKRYIGREALNESEISFQKLKNFYRDKEWMTERIDKLEYNLYLMSKMTPFAAINFLRQGIGYEEYLKEYAEYRRIKLEELLDLLNEIQESAKAFSSFQDWFHHMEEYAVSLKNQMKEQQKQENTVTFTTLHGAKGLEFPIVFLVDVHEENIPYRKAVLDMDIQEERRMFYVGMTRAKEHLHIYYAKEKYGKTLERSRFIEELLVPMKNS